MSEPSSLYIKVKIEHAHLNSFFAASPATAAASKNQEAWWQSRKMYSPMDLPQGLFIQAATNRAVFDELLADRRAVAMEEYDEASQEWTFLCLMFSENYREILPMLNCCASLADYLQGDENGIALIYDYFWGSTDVMVELRLRPHEAYYELTSHMTELVNADAAIIKTKIDSLLSEGQDPYNSPD